MNPHLGYLKTKRARAKVKSWFKQQDYELNKIDGKASYERELNRMALHNVSQKVLLDHYHVNSMDDLFSSIGRGDITSGQLTNTLHELFEKQTDAIPINAKKPPVNKKFVKGDEVRIRGVANLLTTIGNCCKPVPGDQIVGFITKGQGVTIHRRDCVNVINMDKENLCRLIEADWGDNLGKSYTVSIHIEAFDRQGLLRDVSKVLSDEKVDVIGVNTLSNKDQQTADMTITVEIADLNQLGRVMDKINQLQNIISVSRSHS
jgi:GTP pyrophosphokinase